MIHGSHRTVWKLRKFTLTLFWQKFRESNIFTKEITKYSQDPNCRVCTAIYFGTKILPTWPNQVPTRLSIFRSLNFQLAKTVKICHFWPNSVLKSKTFSSLHAYLGLHANSFLENCAPYMLIRDYTAIRILRVIDFETGCMESK